MHRNGRSMQATESYRLASCPALIDNRTSLNIPLLNIPLHAMHFDDLSPPSSQLSQELSALEWAEHQHDDARLIISALSLMGGVYAQ